MERVNPHVVVGSAVHSGHASVSAFRSRQPAERQAVGDFRQRGTGDTSRGLQPNGIIAIDFPCLRKRAAWTSDGLLFQPQDYVRKPKVQATTYWGTHSKPGRTKLNLTPRQVRPRLIGGGEKHVQNAGLFRGRNDVLQGGVLGKTDLAVNRPNGVNPIFRMTAGVAGPQFPYCGVSPVPAP